MGGEPWMYFVPYERNVQSALEKLKEREFRAGRYYPVLTEIPFPVDPDGPAPGAAHASIADARDAADATGTRSILDMNRVSATPPRGPNLHEQIERAVRQSRGGVVDLGFMVGGDFGHGVVTPVPSETLEELYGTEKPTREAVERAPEFLEEVDRGTGVYVILYVGDFPREICFAGYSYD
jgi:hypothetical protein